MPTRFEARKQRILEQLDAPDDEYHDLSPKGSVDAPIRDLIGEINKLQGLVTTSSCSGRISVFLEGRKADTETSNSALEGEESRAGPGGKGGGGAWLFLSHTPVERVEANHDLMSEFGFQTIETEESTPDVSCRYVHLKFEPMILHILSASMDHAQKVLTAALTAGFRESGAVSLGSANTGESNPMVAVRSAGYSFDSIIGYQDGNGCNVALVSLQYLRTLVNIANERFKINLDRISRFRQALLQAHQPKLPSGSKSCWEDADVRKRRKREEGLARQQALQSRNSEINIDTLEKVDVGNMEGMFS
ncbi:tRNA wybutosine-synthesizing protein 3 [Alternaria panax]|uniref:tRNA(Phe) 7-[(3-amino-3-carboxypropyl)-4-demethylwyosine(37)-N(4)]-methyltransferase n=1 Tax=Alternaria panax TaxID=48097 RepID=A0AAD4FAK6_9PLEO|nr:tRNA wybutosine-synthesizing protein 3 [Alternaria panax]